MADELDEVGGADAGASVDLLAAQLRADAGDADTFFTVLVTKLRDALGDRVTVEGGGRGLLRRDRPATGVAVDLTEAGDGVVLRAQRSPSGIQCTAARPVRGIVVSNRAVPMAEWLQLLADGLAQQAGRSEATRRALGELLT